jgi:hypothetical protein
MGKKYIVEQRSYLRDPKFFPTAGRKLGGHAV